VADELDQLTRAQSLENLASVAGAYRGTAREHAVLQASVGKLEKALALLDAFEAEKAAAAASAAPSGA
jgi:hypothetical protein